MPPTILASSSRTLLRAFFAFLIVLSTNTALLFPYTTKAALTDGLVGYWSFNGPDIADKIYDRSGSANNGYFSGGSTSSAKTIGKLGQALRFDGSNDEVLLGTQSYPANFTVTAWMKPDVASFPLGPAIFGIGNVYFGVGDTGLYFWNNGAGDSGDFGATATEGIWQHVAFVYNGTNVRAYLDGATAGSPLTATISTTFDASIGSSGTGAQYFKGLLDDVRVYDRALSPTEVKQLYNFGKALQKPPNNLGLVGYWSFNEGNGTIATDFSGGGNAGMLGTNGGTIPTWTNGKRGKALNFDGSTNYVSVPSSPSLNPTSQITVSAWVRANSWGGGRRIVEKGDSGNQYRLFDNAGTLSFYLTGVTELDAGPVPSTEAWHHIVGTYNGSTNSVYVDGALLGSENPGQVVIPTSSDNLYIGTRAACSISASNCFDGSIDEVRIYNRGLSASEVTRLYSSGAVQIGVSMQTLQQGTTLANGLVGHWTFDGPDTQPTITDRSGQNNHGYFKGGATSSAKIAGKLGQALNFIRANSTRVDMSNDLMASGDRTACAWVNLNSISADEFQSIFDTGGFYFLQYYLTGGQYFIFFTSQNSFGDAVLLPSSPIGVWNHVCAVRPSAAGNASIYLNGALLGTVDDGAPTAGVSLSIGGHDSSPTTYFSGSIDDARVYNRMLTAAEVRQLYQLGTVIIRP